MVTQMVVVTVANLAEKTVQQKVVRTVVMMVEEMDLTMAELTVDKKVVMKEK